MPLTLVVCVKQIPNPDLQFQIAPGGLDIRRETLNYKVNGADEYALEAAVRLKEKHGGRGVAITAGPERAEAGLREGRAQGAAGAGRGRGRAALPRSPHQPQITPAPQPIKDVSSSEVSLPYTFKVRRLIPPP